VRHTFLNYRVATRQRYDVQALADIYDQYSPKLYWYALRLLGDDNYEECVAETFNRFLGAEREAGQIFAGICSV
jgi:DNA-directed RNA polymerase specialized sigma24 family protein